MLELSIGITAYRQLKWDPLNFSSLGVMDCAVRSVFARRVYYVQLVFSVLFLLLCCYIVVIYKSPLWAFSFCVYALDLRSLAT